MRAIPNWVWLLAAAGVGYWIYRQSQTAVARVATDSDRAQQLLTSGTYDPQALRMKALSA